MNFRLNLAAAFFGMLRPKTSRSRPFRRLRMFNP
jgi:hypothetical protein